MYWITALLGLALGASPWVFSYTDNAMAFWVSIAIGVVLFAVSAYKAVMQDERQYWEYWLAGLAGIAAVAAPFILGFSTVTAALWASIIVGLLAVIIAGYEVFFVQPEGL